ncbi:Hypothetical predicted protein [Paramuricea clavata]|uniref:Uncharacterized protein n=1 Tax=Paramuricea clavata TaxID=317549 RepID=A0A6S7JG83_PARCT|nr:Hypothetical predicted protein [Paramuricea clavata]
MRQPNRAIHRERHTTPTIDDLIHDLNGATVFSKIDLNSGYHQLELAPESRYITTFSTHRGLRRYTRLNFGTSSAAEVFQDAIQQVLSGIEGARNVSAHFCARHAVFERLRSKNLTLNAKKCEFNKSSIEFFGYIFSRNGFSPDPKKVSAINNTSPQFPRDTVLSYFNPHNAATIIVEVNENNGIPKQNEKPSVYCLRVNIFIFTLYGAKFNIITDHKPLERIFTNPAARSNARLERWAFKLKLYHFTISYSPGKTNPADYLSRHILATTHPSTASDQAEEYIAFLADHTTPKAMTVSEVKQSTRADPTLQAVIEALRNNTWHSTFETPSPLVNSQDLHALYNIRDELSVSDYHDLLLRSHRLILLHALRQRALHIAHEGHQGLTKTRAL